MTTERVLDEVARERLRQETLRAEGRFRYTCADRGMDDGNKLACLAEEFGEVAKTMLHNRRLVSDGGGDLRTELIHVAAVAVAWAESIPAQAEEHPESREGMVTVYRADGTYAGCMGVERWERLVREDQGEEQTL